ncbi:ESX-1 secretion-associated protein [Mycobacterium sp. MMS18-G62]
MAVTAQYVRALSELQKKAARGVNDALLAVSGVGDNVAKTHGSICSVTATAVKTAETERNTAATRVRDQSSDLAVKLEHAADKYDEIDQTEKANLDNQMKPGG